MEFILTAKLEIFIFPGKERSGYQSRTGKIENRILKRNFFRHNCSCVSGFKFKRRNKSRKNKIFGHFGFNVTHVFSVHCVCGETAEKSGGNVVRVSFNFSGDIEKFILRERPAENFVCAENTADYAGGT